MWVNGPGFLMLSSEEWSEVTVSDNADNVVLLTGIKDIPNVGVNGSVISGLLNIILIFQSSSM